MASNALLLAGVAAFLAAQPVSPTRYEIDSSASRATVAVGKSGPLSFAAGHSHEVVAGRMTGEIDVDAAAPSRSHVRLTIDASSLKVTGKGESADDVPKVQATMESDRVLDVSRYPSITFESSGIAIKQQSAGALDCVVAGSVTLRGATRPVSAPVSVRFDGGRLLATGRFALKQSDFAIKPVTVGGVVSVKDAVDITFSIAAQ